MEDSSRGGDISDDDWVPQTSAHHIAMMASRRGNVKDTGHDSDGEESTLSDVESDDEISPRDDRARRRAGDAPSADSTTETLEVRVKGQNGVNEVVAPNSDQPRTSPRFHIGSTGALPGRRIGDERFLGGRTKRPNKNRTSLRSALTGRFISRRLLHLTIYSMPGSLWLLQIKRGSEGKQVTVKLLALTEWYVNKMVY